MGFVKTPILCHNCYMKIVEWDQNKKKKTKIIKKQSNYDFTYQLPNQNHVTISQKNYESLSEKAKGLKNCKSI